MFMQSGFVGVAHEPRLHEHDVHTMLPFVLYVSKPRPEGDEQGKGDSRFRASPPAL